MQEFEINRKLGKVGNPRKQEIRKSRNYEEVGYQKKSRQSEKVRNQKKQEIGKSRKSKKLEIKKK